MSNDLEKMLYVIRDPSPSAPSGISDRKLRLFGCACFRQVWHLLTDHRSRKAVEVAEQFADGEATVIQLGVAAYDSIAVGDVGSLEMGICYLDRLNIFQLFKNEGVKRPWPSDSDVAQAELLRCIASNPLRPWWVETGESLHEKPLAQDPGGRLQLTSTLRQMQIRPRVIERRWLTPTVLSLAQVAYEQRPGRACSRCNGRGEVASPEGVEGLLLEEEAAGAPTLSGSWQRCPDCHGTGRINDGVLDPVTLLAVADALEEAGCEPAVCWACNGSKRQWETGAGFDYEITCRGCGGTGYEPEHLLTHLRSSGPHYRGCWALDLILGKE